jgi:neutral trehalase
MELHLTPESPLTDLTDDELVELLEEHYFTLATTGSQALDAILWDITQGIFMDYHGLDDERMMRVFLRLAKYLCRAWNTTAIDYYKQVNSQ